MKKSERNDENKPLAEVNRFGSRALNEATN